MNASSPSDPDSRPHPFGVADTDVAENEDDDSETVEEFVDDESVPPVDGILPAWDHTHPDDDYADFEHEAARIEALFKDPHFAEMAAGRNELRPPKSTQAKGSIGRAMALGFANVFDPDRVKDDVMVIAERGEGDPDLPETTIDPEDPKHTRVVFRGRKKR